MRGRGVAIGAAGLAVLLGARLTPWKGQSVLIEAASQVGPALFFSLLVITVSFLPIFTLEAEEGRLFGPLAFTKTFAMAGWRAVAGAVARIGAVPHGCQIGQRPQRQRPGKLWGADGKA